jgi:oligoribonuclease
MIVFLDLETTGLRATQHDVLEVAAIVTDDELREVARFHRVVAATRRFSELDEFIRDMHTKNGLWAEAIRPPDDYIHSTGVLYRQADGGTYPLGEVDHSLSEFIVKHAVKLGTNDKGQVTIARPQLAGNSIHFDRAFMKEHLPESEAQLHYRMIDVSTVDELARRFWKATHDARPKPNDAHRAMPDVEHSLALARYYSAALQAPSSPAHIDALVAKAPGEQARKQIIEFFRPLVEGGRPSWPGQYVYGLCRDLHPDELHYLWWKDVEVLP